MLPDDRNRDGHYMKCVIVQPSYIPWRGFFHLIHKADLFVFYDDVQYDSRGWRHRNKITSKCGPVWLSIPVSHKGSQQTGMRICDARVVWDRNWLEKHWAALESTYARSPFFKSVSETIKPYYERRVELLCDLTIPLTIAIARSLGIHDTNFVRSSTLDARGTKTERLLDILQKVSADHYLSGPSAMSYIDEIQLKQAGIELEFMQYSYPDYPQLYPPFQPNLSILDLMFMTGGDAARYIWGLDD